MHTLVKKYVNHSTRLTIQTVDFTTENAYRTSAVKSTWFKRLPPNLIIQLQVHNTNFIFTQIENIV